MSKQTVVVLGASNLTIGWRYLVGALQIGLPSPLDIYVAGGLGRSYIGPSRFAHRSLPGILHSGIWDALRISGVQQTRPVALLTDLGNDLVYGSDVVDVIQAADECIARLREFHREIDIVVTRPPRKAVENLSLLRFRFFRSVLFPFSQLRLPEILQATAELDEQVVNLATRQQVAVIQPEAAWYGLDPIHVRRSCRIEAFCRMAESWAAWQPVARATDRAAAAVARPIPQQQTSFGRNVTTQQPSRRYVNAVVHAF